MIEFNPTKAEAVKAEAIRRSYMEKGTTKLDRLQALDAKVKTPGTVVACIIGIGGALITGAGMSNIMVWGNMTPGLAMGIPGLAMVCASFPIYSMITSRRKKKYAGQIMALSGEIIDEQEGAR